MTRSLLLPSLLLPSLVLLSLGCGPASNKPTGKPINVGVIVPQTGGQAAAGFSQAVQFAIDEINDHGGVLGRPLNGVYGDDQTDDSGAPAVAVVNDMIANQAIDVFNCCSTSNISMAVVQQSTLPNKATLLGYAVASAAFTALHNPGGPADPALNGGVNYAWRTQPLTASVESKAVTVEMIGEGITTSAIIYVQGSYGSGLLGAFKTAFAAGAGSTHGTVGVTQMYIPAQTDYTSVLAPIFGVANPPQAVYLIGYEQDTSTIIANYATQYAGNAIWYLSVANGVGGQFIPLTSQKGGSSVFPNIRQMGNNHPDTADYAAFEAKMTAAIPGWYFQRPYTNAYDDMYLIALAMQLAKATDSTSVSKNLSAIGNGVLSSTDTAYGPLSYEDAVAAIKAGKGMRYEGTGGDLTFDVNGDVPPATYSVREIQNSTFVTTVNAIPL